jgi:hypothetical protein
MFPLHVCGKKETTFTTQFLKHMSLKIVFKTNNSLEPNRRIKTHNCVQLMKLDIMRVTCTN